VGKSARSLHDGRVKEQRTPEEDAKSLAELAAAISKARAAKKMTQEELAYQAGVALRTLQNLEAGTLNARYTTLKSVAKGLSVSVSSLTRGL
jgi:transcriptional regulator with XRE-family HTH domain